MVASEMKSLSTNKQTKLPVDVNSQRFGSFSFIATDNEHKQETPFLLQLCGQKIVQGIALYSWTESFVYTTKYKCSIYALLRMFERSGKKGKNRNRGKRKIKLLPNANANANADANTDANADANADATYRSKISNESVV